MSSSEQFPITDNLSNQQGSIFYEDGSLNEEYLLNNYGLTDKEANQQVTFGNYTGSVAQMLDDERCPVGSMVQAAYEEKGIIGVTEKFKNLSEMDHRFSVAISSDTLQRDQVKKK